jgi:hypothetical protein
MAGVRQFGDDRAEVQLTEQLRDAGVIADSHTNLQGNGRLYDDIAEIDDIAETEIAETETADIAEVEEPLMPLMPQALLTPVMSVMPVTPVMPSTHSVELRIDQFTHFTHDFDPQGFACEQHLAQGKPAPHSCLIPAAGFSICDRSHRRPTVAVSFGYALLDLRCVCDFAPTANGGACLDLLIERVHIAEALLELTAREDRVFRACQVGLLDRIVCELEAPRRWQRSVYFRPGQFRKVLIH